jgi:hypothetical protein
MRRARHLLATAPQWRGDARRARMLAVGRGVRVCGDDLANHVGAWGLGISLGSSDHAHSRHPYVRRYKGNVAMLLREIPGNFAWYGVYEGSCKLCIPAGGTKADLGPAGAQHARAVGVVECVVPVPSFGFQSSPAFALATLAGSRLVCGLVLMAQQLKPPGGRGSASRGRGDEWHDLLDRLLPW